MATGAESRPYRIRGVSLGADLVLQMAAAGRTIAEIPLYRGAHKVPRIGHVSRASASPSWLLIHSTFVGALRLSGMIVPMTLDDPITCWRSSFMSDGCDRDISDRRRPSR